MNGDEGQKDWSHPVTTAGDRCEKSHFWPGPVACNEYSLRSWACQDEQHQLDSHIAFVDGKHWAESGLSH